MVGRMLSLYLPSWPIDRVRRLWPECRRRSPLLLVEHRRGTQWVAAGSPDVRGRGVRVGMTLAHAQTLIPEAEAAPFDPGGDHAALEKLALWANRFSPAVAVDPPDGLLLDITGCELLFHGERNVLIQAARAIEAFGVTVRAAIADTIGAAWAVAHAGDEAQSVIPPGQQYAALAHLPPWALRLSSDAVAQLAALGMDRIEALLMLPRSSLPSRFGDPLVRRVDQALGREAETITPLHPPLVPLVEMDFEGSVSNRDVLLSAMRTLLDPLALQLRQRGCGARRVEVALWRQRRCVERRSVTLSGPSRSARHLAILVGGLIEGLRVAGGVDGMQLIVPETGPMSDEQGDFFEAGSGADQEEAAELFDRLALRLGADRVIRPALTESHLPERAWRAAQTAAGWTHERKGGRKSAGAEPSPPPNRDAALFRPLRLLPQPQPMQAMAVVPDQPPIWIRHQGREQRIRRGWGPERICGEWWRDDGDPRDYYQIETEAGARSWVFRHEASGQWFMHGMFD